MLETKNGEPIVETRVVANFWDDGFHTVKLTASDLRAEQQRIYDREIRDDMIREAKLDAARDC